jgi:nucleotide-binding universal stress UspA family protein
MPAAGFHFERRCIMPSAQSCPLTKLEKILVSSDRSEFSEGAVREAIQLSTKCASRLFITSVLETNPEYETIGAGVYQKEEAQAEKFLEALETRAAGEGVHSCEAFLLFGNDPYRRIVEAAAEKAVDMIVIGRRGRSGIMKVLMGQTAAKVIGHAPCTVLVVPRAARIECRTILVATDGSAHSVAAVAEAVRMAKRCSGQLIALSSAYSEQDLDEARTNVHAAAEVANKEGVAVETLTPIGKSHNVIVETAGGRGVDLIVMGNFGKTGLKKLFMGSSTERVIGHAQCAVMVVRAK